MDKNLNDLTYLLAEEELKSTHELMFSNDKPIFMKYEEGDIYIDSICVSNQYNFEIFKDNKIEKRISKDNSNLDRIINYNEEKPIVHNYDNSENKSGDRFTLKINNNIQMSFNKDVSVIEVPNKHCLVYKTGNDGLINYNTDPLEKYIFIDNGSILLSLPDRKTFIPGARCANIGKIDFNIFLKKNNKFNYPILNSLPTDIVYDKYSEYTVLYDDNGIVKKCIDKSNPKKLLSRYECIDNNITSIHPLLYDPFNYSNIGVPLELWCLDYIDFGNITRFNRYIFKINEADKLIQILNSNTDKPIISI